MTPSNFVQVMQEVPAYIAIPIVLGLVGLLVLFVFALAIMWASLWLDVLVPFVDAYILQDDQARPIEETEEIAQCRAEYWNACARTGIYFM